MSSVKTACLTLLFEMFFFLLFLGFVFFAHNGHIPAAQKPLTSELRVDNIDNNLPFS